MVFDKFLQTMVTEVRNHVTSQTETITREFQEARIAQQAAQREVDGLLKQVLDARQDAEEATRHSVELSTRMETLAVELAATRKECDRQRQEANDAKSQASTVKQITQIEVRQRVPAAPVGCTWLTLVKCRARPMQLFSNARLKR